MRYAMSLVAAFVIMVAAVAQGQEPTKGQLVSLDLLFADVVGDAAGDAEITAAKILELEKQGKLQSVARVQLSTVENQQSSTQFGEQVPVMTGRMSRGGGGPGPGGGFPGAGEVGASYSMQQVGTMVQAVTRIDQDGTILVNLTAERTRLMTNRPAGEEAGVPSIAATKTGTTNNRTTVRVASGKPVIVCGQQIGAGKEAIHSYVVLTATAAEGAKVSAVPNEVIKVFTMTHARAAEMVNHVRTVLGGEPISVAADERTNSLIVSGPERALEAVRALIAHLDEAISTTK